MKKIRMLLPTGAVIGMLVVGFRFAKDIWKVISTNTTRLKYRTRTATWKS